MSTRDAILAAGLEAFDTVGFDQATVAAIRAAAGVSNGSFFHFFGAKEQLAAALFLEAITAYHAAMLAPLRDDPTAPAGIAGLIHAHLDWVVDNRPRAKFLFEQARAEWLAHIRDEQAVENTAFGAGIEAWQAPLTAAGTLRALPAAMFAAQIIGPAQIFCRAWLSGRSAADPSAQAPALIDCAHRALLARQEP